jgi:mannose-6-phosphate isomerase-like protein (cupin superfamily)
MNKNEHVDIIFPKQESIGKRDWGEEKLVVLIPEVISLKILTINKGKKGGLQYHHKKNECGYIFSGELLIRFDKGDGILNEKILHPGDSFHFPPKSVHQEEALSDCVIVEASTPYFNDRVRVEDIYGLPAEGGLPSVKESEIIFR